MSHDHSHHHHDLKNISRTFWIGIVLNAAFVVIEFIAGFTSNSLSLLSDAGHNLSDVASLGLSLFALKISGSKATATFTYGYHKTTILASLVNAVILLIAVGSIGWEAILRFIHPTETKGGVIAIVAGIGIVINSVSAFLFFRDKEKDLNSKGAYLHLASDAIVSAGVVISGIIILYTGIKWIDPLISLVIMAVVVYGTWGLLKESLFLTLDAVPKNVDMEKITQELLKIKGVKEVYHIHVWAMSTSRNAMTAHLVLDDALDKEEISVLKQKIKHELLHLNVEHVTLETELKDHNKKKLKTGSDLEIL